MNWIALWMNLFGRTTLFGLDMGFWVSMTVVLVIVIAMNVVFWSMKPKNRPLLKGKAGNGHREGADNIGSSMSD